MQGTCQKFQYHTCSNSLLLNIHNLEFQPKKTSRHTNSNLYAYAANNPVKYTDPDGKIILAINDTFNMSINPLGDKKLGKSKTTTFRQEGCYVTTFANIFSSSKYYGLPLTNAYKYDTPDKINSDKNLFKDESTELNGRENSMNALFGKNKWDYWTKAVQGTDGLKEKIDEYAKSDKAFMIVGIFDLSSDTEGVTNHMVGISEAPDENGVFHNLTPTSNGDINRGINITNDNAYTLDNLKEIRVIFLED